MAQKSILTLLQAVAAELNLPQPTTVLSNQDQNVKKLLALARATCDDLLAEYDWQVLQTRVAFTTTDGVSTYSFPTDLGHFISGTFFDANNAWPMNGPATPVQWEWLKASNVQGAPFTSFRVFGDKIVLTPTPGPSQITLNFNYISTSYIVDGSSGTPKTDFTQDSDVCRFDHRVVIYGIKLKWRESISQDTTTALSDYKRSLEFAKGSDQPAMKLNLRGGETFAGLSTANYPDGSWVV